LKRWLGGAIGGKMFYRWPCGIFEDMELTPSVYTKRLTPTTPQGDFVCYCKSKEEADKLVDYLNRGNFSFEEAKIHCGNTD
jgi:hypothetical protein